MAEGLRRQQAAARRALHEALLDQEGLDDLLDRVARLRERRGDGLDADRAAAEALGDQAEIAPVELVEAERIDLEPAAAPCRRPCASIASTPSTAAKSRTRRSSRVAMRGVPRERRAISVRAVGGEGDAEDAGAAAHDVFEFVHRVEIEPDRNAEAVAERRRQQAEPRRRADQRERREVDLHRARRRPLADDQVELEILERRIEDFLDRRRQAVDLVDEEDVALLEIGEQRREVAGLGDHRTGGGAEIDAELARDDLRQRRLAEAGRADEEDVVERLLARRAPPR